LKQAKGAANNVGPGSYTIANQAAANSKVRLNSDYYQGFMSKETRFNNDSYKNRTPGPGQYSSQSLAQGLQNKTNAKGGVFGTTQRRFINNNAKTQVPGPGQYNDQVATSRKAKPKQNAVRDLIKKSNSMYL